MTTDGRDLVVWVAVALAECAQRPRTDGRTPPAELAQLARELVDALRRPESAQLDEAAAGAEAESVTPDLLTRADAARRLRCSVSTVDRLVASGELATVHVGRSVRIRPADLADYVAALPARSFRERVGMKDAGTDRTPGTAPFTAAPSPASPVGAGDPSNERQSA